MSEHGRKTSLTNGVILAPHRIQATDSSERWFRTGLWCVVIRTDKEFLWARRMTFLVSRLQEAYTWKKKNLWKNKLNDHDIRCRYLSRIMQQFYYDIFWQHNFSRSNRCNPINFSLFVYARTPQQKQQTVFSQLGTSFPFQTFTGRCGDAWHINGNNFVHRHTHLRKSA